MQVFTLEKWWLPPVPINTDVPFLYVSKRLKLDWAGVPKRKKIHKMYPNDTRNTVILMLGLP